MKNSNISIHAVKDMKLITAWPPEPISKPRLIAIHIKLVRIFMDAPTIPSITPILIVIFIHFRFFCALKHRAYIFSLQ